MYLLVLNACTLIVAVKMEGLANRSDGSSYWVISIYLSSYNLFVYLIDISDL